MSVVIDGKEYPTLKGHISQLKAAVKKACTTNPYVVNTLAAIGTVTVMIAPFALEVWVNTL